MLINYSDRFLKNASRLPKKLIALAEEKETLFKENQYHPLLRTHKLKGKDRGLWAFWINQKYRIKFDFISESSVLFTDIGTHDIYE